MTVLEKNAIIENVNRIVGARNIKIGRVVDLIWIAMQGIDGRDYALHLQTFFRFCKDEKVLITDTDKYSPISSTNDSEDFHWDVIGSNLLDRWCDEFNRNLSPNICVESVEINNYGDLKICFSHSITLTVFIDTTSDDECWRFFIWRGGRKTSRDNRQRDSVSGG
ncbi:MAG: hypothetical protein NC543_15830 [bacterium]|nr:hypothetical protein [bacterium]MCM1374009.1 hypothetical protein [Muribaculum sp.]